MTGEIEPWQARKAATLTRPLTLAQVRSVAEAVATALASLPFSRAARVIEAAVVAADPVAHHARLREQANRRYVATGRVEGLTELRSLILHGAREEVARVEGMVTQLAAALAVLGDTDTLASRRVKALVLMAHPAHACLILARAYPPPDPAVGEPSPEPERDGGESSPLGLAVLFGRLLAEGGTRTLERLRPRTVLYLHLAEEAVHAAVHGLNPPEEPVGVVRAQDLGPATLEEVGRWVAHDRVEVRPVIDVNAMTPVDAYEVPARMREAVQLREPFEAFPFGTAAAHRADQDHTIPYVSLEDGGPPGQTRPGNLGPLGRRHHGAKTFGAFSCHEPLPGLYLWRTPSGHWYRRDHTGDQHLGRTTPDIIRQAEPPPSPVEHAFLNVLLDTSQIGAGA